MAFDNSGPPPPPIQMPLPLRGISGAHSAPLLGTTVGDWPPTSPSNNAGPNRAPCVGQRQVERPQGLLISNSSLGAGPLKRSSNNDCVMMWKRQQNLSSATNRQRREGKPCPKSLGFLHMPLFFLMQAFPLRIRLMFFSVWGASNLAGSICAVCDWTVEIPKPDWAPYHVQHTNYAKQHPSAAQIELQPEPVLCHCSGRSPPLPG